MVQSTTGNTLIQNFIIKGVGLESDRNSATDEYI